MLVRQIDDAVLDRIKARAKANGRSAEAEVRDILERAVREPVERRSLRSLIGAGASPTSFKSTEEIVAYVRALRDEGGD
ncbi:FitA-like ribbon-helix-helix domain-containing protein [Jiella sonneratiae]|uniref:Arc family DNA-binding protein n=1 Tax=Jiella sonneratiae TaxID=2816856 RepID=A0ABS3J9K3_9HYPH|nr:Arc family DNA-binding protein [Jiella sonneratiae]MBO0906363.1 Arc family DNA-binding protein [Jiella sonneratiae]